MFGYIYKITHPLTNYCYIGSTAFPIRRLLLWEQEYHDFLVSFHRCHEMFKFMYENKLLISDMTFTYITCMNFKSRQHNKHEQYWMNIYTNGFWNQIPSYSDRRPRVQPINITIPIVLRNERDCKMLADFIVSRKSPVKKHIIRKKLPQLEKYSFEHFKIPKDFWIIPESDEDCDNINGKSITRAEKFNIECQHYTLTFQEICKLYPDEQELQRTIMACTVQIILKFRLFNVKNMIKSIKK